ncbi:MAG: hypothetical protein Q9211_005177 [Gyalolechia sp. 1 TL-2023]
MSRPWVASFHSSGPLRKDKYKRKIAKKKAKEAKAKEAKTKFVRSNTISRSIFSVSPPFISSEPPSPSRRELPPTPPSSSIPISKPPSSSSYQSPPPSSSPPPPTFSNQPKSDSLPLPGSPHRKVLASPPLPTPSSPSQLPHLTSFSEVHQISITSKTPTPREAIAIGSVRFSSPRLGRLIEKHALEKGDVLAVARVAGIMAVKNTSTLIPLAHSGIAVEGCVVDVHVVGPTSAAAQHPPAPSPTSSPEEMTEEDKAPISPHQLASWLISPISPHGGIRIKVRTESSGKTGVEMEALTGVLGAALTVVDMCKGVDRGCVVEDVRVVGKKGGKTGAWGVLANGNGPDAGEPAQGDQASGDHQVKEPVQEPGLWGRESRVDGQPVFVPPRLHLRRKYSPVRDDNGAREA